MICDFPAACLEYFLGTALLWEAIILEVEGILGEDEAFAAVRGLAIGWDSVCCWTRYCDQYWADGLSGSQYKPSLYATPLQAIPDLQARFIVPQSRK